MTTTLPDRPPRVNRVSPPGRRVSPAADPLLVARASEGWSDGRVAAELGCNPSTVTHRRHRLGIPANVSAGRPWAADEDALLRAEYRATPVRELAARLGRHWTRVRDRARRLGLQPPQAPAWTPADDAALARLVAAGATAEDAGARLGRTPGAVMFRRRALGLPGLRAGMPAAFGLPADLGRHHALAALALLDGPLTGPELAAAVGGPAAAKRSVARLRPLGLLAVTPLAGGRSLYALSPLALDLIAAARQEAARG